MLQYKNDVKAFIRAGALDEPGITDVAAIRELARHRDMTLDHAERVWNACTALVAPVAPVLRAVTLPCGKRISLANYVKGWKAVKAIAATTPMEEINGWDWFSVPAAWIYRDIIAGLHDRISQGIPRIQRGVIALALVLVASAASAQYSNATRDAQGNFHETSSPTAAAHDSTTTFTYTYSNPTGTKTYTIPVFRGPKGGLYTWRLDGKTGVQRKVYLPKQ